VSLLELVQLNTHARRELERIHSTEVYRLRGSLLPVVHLSDALGLSSGDLDPAAGEDDLPVSMVVLRADDRQFGLVVDEVKDTEEIVVKPLGKELKSVSAFAGATIMGDGGVALILDVIGLAQRAGVVSDVRERSVGDLVDGDPGSQAAETHSLLVFGAGTDSRLAIPLSLVSRLEEFSLDQLERAGHRHVVQYRGEILPLIEVSKALGLAPLIDCHPGRDPESAIPVIVVADRGRTVGLVVDQVVDVFEDTVAIQPRTARACVHGAAIIGGKVTELLDVDQVIERHELGLASAARAA
jgi:two-component system chemotaxis sensor kinase CheA